MKLGLEQPWKPAHLQWPAMLLITGGMGFIGLHTARCFLDAGQDVVLTHFKTRREPDFIRDELGKRAQVESLDVADGSAVQQVMQRYPIDGIVHLAVPGLGALSAADEYRTNTQGLLNVLEAGRQANVKRVTVASSIAVYGSLDQGPFREDDRLPVQSSSPTEAYKKSEEILGLHYQQRTGIDVVFGRLGGIYGPLYHSMANLPSRLTHAAVQGRPPDFSGMRGQPLADQANDLCYVKDCARGVQLLHLADGLKHRVYNIGGGRAVTNRELAEAVNAAVPGATIQLEAGRDPRAQRERYMDLTRARDDFGYEPQYDIRAAIADYVAWLRANPQ
jgi:UDP-glucose 4-epimerase